MALPFLEVYTPSRQEILQAPSGARYLELFLQRSAY